MNKSILDQKKHIHMIGIGGSGMYPLAQILHAKGFYVTGSDNNETDTLQAVRNMGIPVTLGQKAENIQGADLIVHTAAIMADNPELIAAKNSGVPVLERSELLGIVSSWYPNAVCVSGTHGKTTTTAMLAQILYTAKIDLSAFIGGKLPCIGGSGCAGSSDIFVCESCEFVDTFLKLYPDIAIILNIDADHLDYFKTVDNIIRSFHKFCELTSRTILYNGDDENTCRAVAGITDKEFISFGYGEENQFRAVEISHTGTQTAYTVMKSGEILGRITLQVPGEHNILNSLAAVAACDLLGIPFASVAQGLAEFRGAGRRFEIKAQINGITIADDYAHHPTELTATLRAAKQMNYNRIIAVFQPFTFSRTVQHLEEFARSLEIADLAVLTDIMGSREKNTYQIYTRNLAEIMHNAVYFPQDEQAEYTDERKYQNFEDVCHYVLENAKPGDLVLTMGCGDVNKIAAMLVRQLTEIHGKQEETA
ncbi:MAG: UDP-N-acetylmuramate--L-alanine ligase [Oscillospiraceae bacterium]|nr:UDP-N-acetylmuramate--L-alanine ligase [Oscillospiraceae bacterium]